MAADYRAALPLPVAGAGTLPPDAGDQRSAALHRRAPARSARRSAAPATLRGEIREQQRELERRAEWGMSLDREIKRAQATIAQAGTIEQCSESQRWPYREQLADLSRRDTRNSKANSRTARAGPSRSMRELADDAREHVVAPDRTVALRRRARFARRACALAFALARLRTIVKRTRGSLASRGLFGTFRRIRDEFRRGTPLPLMLSIARAGARRSSRSRCRSARRPRVSIVIPVYNKIDYTVACLRSLAEHAGTAAFEVIVVDDASSDATAERLAQIGGVRVHPQRAESRLRRFMQCRRGSCARRVRAVPQQRYRGHRRLARSAAALLRRGTRCRPGRRQTRLSRRTPAGSRRHRVSRRLGLELRPLRRSCRPALQLPPRSRLLLGRGDHDPARIASASSAASTRATRRPTTRTPTWPSPCARPA